MIDTAFARYYLYDIGVSPQYQIYNIEPCTMPDCGHVAAIIIIIACDNIKMIIANILTWLARL